MKETAGPDSGFQYQDNHMCADIKQKSILCVELAGDDAWPENATV